MEDEVFFKVYCFLLWFNIATYSSTLVWAIRNSYQYLYRLKRFHEFYLVVFYVLSIIICVSKIAYISL